MGQGVPRGQEESKLDSSVVNWLASVDVGMLELNVGAEGQDGGVGPGALGDLRCWRGVLRVCRENGRSLGGCRLWSVRYRGVSWKEGCASHERIWGDRT